MERKLSKLTSPSSKQSSFIATTPKDSQHRMNKSMSFQTLGFRPAAATRQEKVRPKMDTSRPKPLGNMTAVGRLHPGVDMRKGTLMSLHSPQNGSIVNSSKHIATKSMYPSSSASFRKPSFSLLSESVRMANKTNARLIRHSEIPAVEERKSLPLNSADVLLHFRDDLTTYEVSEVLSFETVYYIGTSTHKVQDGNFDNDKGDYIITPGDHVAYRYQVLGILGKGSFGIVVRCLDHKHKEEVALKVIKNKKLFHQQGLVEIRILQTLRDKDKDGVVPIVNMKSSFMFRKHLCITFEMLSLSLYDFLKANRFQGLPAPLIRKLAIQILKALIFIRKLRIIHCDLKPENILLKAENKSTIKLIDFGSSCFENAKMYSYIQSRFYRAPEIILGTGYNMGIDMWSFGCLLAEFAKGMPAFPGENEKHQLALMMEVLGPPPNVIFSRSPKKGLYFDANGTPRVVHSSKGRPVFPGTVPLGMFLPEREATFIDLVAKCLDWNPLTRLTPDEALRHPWITQEPMLDISISKPPLAKSKTSAFLPSAKVTQRVRKISILM